MESGMRFGKLTLRSPASGKGSRQYWECICDCGQICVVEAGHLKSGHTGSCGCKSRRYPELTPGMQFGNLILLEEAARKNGRRYWKCRCDCGREFTAEAGHLKSGHTRSCGCRRRASGKALAADISGFRFGRLTALKPTSRRNKNSVVWECRCDCGQIAYCDVEALNCGQVRSCGCLQKAQRKENMKQAIHFVEDTCIERIAAQKESAANTSGHRGVWRRENGKWRASLTFRKKVYYLGSFDTFEEAVSARLDAEKMYTDFLERYYAGSVPQP